MLRINGLFQFTFILLIIIHVAKSQFQEENGVNLKVVAEPL